MAMTVKNNMSAVQTLNVLNKNSSALQKSLAKVSSGQKIVTPKDDASAYSISERMRAQIRALDQDSRNIQNGSALLKIAAGGIENIVDELRNLRELAINAANDTNSDLDRAGIQKTFNHKIANIDDIAVSTNYNTKTLLDGRYGELDYTKGPVDVVLVVDTTGSMSSYIQDVSNNIKAFTDSLTAEGIDWRVGLVRYDDIHSSASNDVGVESVAFTDGEFTTDTNELISALDNLVATLGSGGDYEESGYEGVMKALEYDFRTDASRQIFVLSDADVHDKNDSNPSLAEYSTEDVAQALHDNGAVLSMIGKMSLTDWTPLVNSTNGKIYDISGDYGNYMKDYADTMDFKSASSRSIFKIHHGPKANQATNFFVGNMQTKYLKSMIPNESDAERLRNLDDDKKIEYQAVLDEAKKMTLGDVSVTTKHGANVAIRVIDGALDYALGWATQVGAYLQRLDYTDSNVVTMNENTQAAESAIRDADMAKEMTEYTKNNVLLQAAQSMLAQANQNSSAVLSLLQ